MSPKLNPLPTITKANGVLTQWKDLKTSTRSKCNVTTTLELVKYYQFKSFASMAGLNQWGAMNINGAIGEYRHPLLRQTCIIKLKSKSFTSCPARIDSFRSIVPWRSVDFPSLWGSSAWANYLCRVILVCFSMLNSWNIFMKSSSDFEIRLYRMWSYVSKGKILEKCDVETI